MHVFNTWLLANVLHPFMAFLLAGVFENATLNYMSLYFMIMIFIFSFVFSLPCLLAAQVIFQLLKCLPASIWMKFFIWLFFLTSFPLGLLVISNRFGAEEFIRFIDGIPATVSVFIIILSRFKPFLQHMSTPKETIQQQ